MSYNFLSIDEGKQQLLKGNTTDGILWSIKLKKYPLARAMQRLSDTEVLIGYDRGYFIVDIAKGKVIHKCKKWREVTSAHRNPDGTTTIVGLNLDKLKGVCVLKLDAKDKVIEKKSIPGDYVRLATVLDNGRYLLCMNDRIVETDENLKEVASYSAEGFLHAWKALRMENGDTLVAGGYGAFIARFNSTGEMIQKFGHKEEVPESISPYFYATIVIADNGDIFVANWQDHGPDNGHKGRQLLRFTPTGEYIESWSFPEHISSFQGLLLL